MEGSARYCYVAVVVAAKVGKALFLHYCPKRNEEQLIKEVKKFSFCVYCLFLNFYDFRVLTMEEEEG